MSESTNQRGFSMIELMVAISILLVGTLAVASMLMKSSDNSISANRGRTSDTTALELMEALKGEIAQIQFSKLDNLRLQKPPGYAARYEYQDDATSTTGTDMNPDPNTEVCAATRTRNGYVYKWRVGEVTSNALASDSSPPNRRLLAEVTVGWNDKKSDPVKYPCNGDPDNCTRRSKITNWIIEPESKCDGHGGRT